MSPPAVSLRNVSKSFGAARPVFEKLSLDVAEGEIVSVLGPSGCGKTTLLRLVARLEEPSEGSIAVLGRSPAQARAGTAFIFQEATLLPWLRVRRNVELPMRLRGVPRAERIAMAGRLLELVSLEDAARLFPRQLSGGMKMRVSIARALALKPRLLLLDEPFGSLDEMTRERLNEDLLRLKEEQAFSALFVTHSVEEAVFLSDRVLVLRGTGASPDIVSVPLKKPRTNALRSTGEFQRAVAEVRRCLRADAVLAK